MVASAGKTTTTTATAIRVAAGGATSSPAPAPHHQNHRRALDNQRRRHRRRHQRRPAASKRALFAAAAAAANNGRPPINAGGLAVALAVAVLLLTAAALAYPSGAPEQACKDLRPGHGAEPQTGAAPFELSQDKLQVGAGDQIKVTLSSPAGTNFKGLIVQASNEAGEPRGKFLPGTGLKALDSCSAVTHSDKEAKKTATLVWQAPDDLKAKEAFVFKATVVKKFDEIYVNIKSSLKAAR